MTRQEKYPDTTSFHYYNANPKGRLTGDCWARAVSTGTEIPYNTVVMEMAELQCKTGYDSSELIDRYLKSKGWVKHKQPKHLDGKKFTGISFCNSVSCFLRHGIRSAEGIAASDRIIANIGGHHIVAIVDGKVWDTWNSTDGCIGNYWVKPVD